MIAAQLFVSGPANGASGSICGHPTIITPPPHERLGQFLTAEIDSTRSPLYSALTQILADITSGRRTRYEGGGEGHLLTIDKDLVTIDTIYADPPEMDQVTLQEFHSVFDRWRSFVSRQEQS